MYRRYSYDCNVCGKTFTTAQWNNTVCNDCVILTDKEDEVEEKEEIKVAPTRDQNPEGISFLSIPPLGLIGLARTMQEGGTKYGSTNYMVSPGVPVKTCIEHAINHLLKYYWGDRSEPHLDHASANCVMASNNAQLFKQENIFSPGLVLTEAMIEENAAARERWKKMTKEERDAVEQWSLSDLSVVKKLLGRKDD